MQNSDTNYILQSARRILGVITIFTILGELFLYPSLDNVYGCLMMAISYYVFQYFLKEKYITQYPFAFLMYTSMFMYRYLPVLATLLEGKPVTYGFENPLETFLHEIILFLVSSLAFYLGCEYALSNGKNNIIKRSLSKLSFYRASPAHLWCIGFFGLAIRIYNYSLGDVEYGDIQGKFTMGLNYLMYAPLVLAFPSLAGLKYQKNKLVIIYAIVVFVVNIASNSRLGVISPIGTILLLFVLYIIRENLRVKNYISFLKLSLIVVAAILFINLLSNVSIAMLYTRKIRTDVDRTELFSATVETMQNDLLMKRLRKIQNAQSDQIKSYKEGWTEDYLDNFMLNRYANMRISDETLYYAKKRGYSNKNMQEFFQKKLLVIFPTPILEFFGTYVDKKNMEYSPGDMLYGKGFGGYRVTSHLGDGLANFGYWYFLIQFVVFFVMFKLLNTFVLKIGSTLIYAPFALMNIFEYLGKFRNSNGVLSELYYIGRYYLQGIVTYLIIYFILDFLIGFFAPRIKRKSLTLPPS